MNASLPERKSPAHPRPLEIWGRPVVIFVTVCTKDRASILADKHMHEFMRNAWHDADAWDMQIRDESHYYSKLEYVRNNPVRKGLVENSEDWPYQGYIEERLW